MDNCELWYKLLITQIALYGRIDANEIESIDILSVNAFFIIMWLLGQMAIWNFLFLRRALPLTKKQELGEARIIKNK